MSNNRTRLANKSLVLDIGAVQQLCNAHIDAVERLERADVMVGELAMGFAKEKNAHAETRAREQLLIAEREKVVLARGGSDHESQRAIMMINEALRGLTNERRAALGKEAVADAEHVLAECEKAVQSAM